MHPKEAEILNRIERLAGDSEQARIWYQQEPLPELGNVTAESLVKSGQEDLVLDFLNHFELAGFA